MKTTEEWRNRLRAELTPPISTGWPYQSAVAGEHALELLDDLDEALTEVERLKELIFSVVNEARVGDEGLCEISVDLLKQLRQVK